MTDVPLCCTINFGLVICVVCNLLQKAEIAAQSPKISRDMSDVISDVTVASQFAALLVTLDILNRSVRIVVEKYRSSMLKGLLWSSSVGRSGSTRYAKREARAVHVTRLKGKLTLLITEAFDGRWLATSTAAISPHTSIAAVAVGSNIVSCLTLQRHFLQRPAPCR